MARIHERVKMQNAAEGTGNGTAMNIAGMETLAAQVSGTFVGTVTFEGTVDESNWVSVLMMNLATGALATTATAPGVFVGSVSGLVQFRARVSARSSGSITVHGQSMEGGIGAHRQVDVASIAAGSNVIGKVSVDQTTVGTTDHVTADVRANGSALLTPNKFVPLAAVDTGSIATVWTPATGKKFRLMGGYISASTAINILFEDNAAGADKFVFRTPTLAANTPFPFGLGNGVLSATANNVLKATGSAAGTVT